jgi:lysozyme
MAMLVSPKGIEICKHYEQGPEGGWAKQPYLCPAKKLTIGYGHVILPNEKFTFPMTESTANFILLEDLNKFAVGVEKILKRKPTQDQFDALVSLAFNVGVGKADGIKGDFADSTLLEYFHKGMIQLAGAEFLKWSHSGGKVLKGLLSRRRTESGLFLNGKVVFY